MMRGDDGGVGGVASKYYLHHFPCAIPVRYENADNYK